MSVSCEVVEFGKRCGRPGLRLCSTHRYLMRRGDNVRLRAPGDNRSKDPLYKIWTHIYSRCYQENNKQYSSYGGRGIRMHDSWNKDIVGWTAFDNFKRDVGDRPEGKHMSGKPVFTLDRINNDGNYEPGNTRWATYHQQNNNTRNNNVVPGVVYDKARGKWKARLKLNGKELINKRFDTYEEAVMCRRNSEKIHL